MNKHLHIVCLDVPCPSDYGCAIDMMSRIRAFRKKGIKIHLHYFEDSNKCRTRELNELCETFEVYERKAPSECLSINTPFCVSSRCNETLINNINKDNYPVLLEGLHTTGIINAISKNNRKICIRMHNVGPIYYKELARQTSNPAKKTYFLAESLLSQKYLPTLPRHHMIACVSEGDKKYFESLEFQNVHYVPAFPAWQTVDSKTGVGNLCLFHGNLSVPENEKAALWLLCNVFNKIRIPFVIAGKNPSKSIQKAADLCQHTCLVSNPCDKEMDDLIEKAHINILPCFSKNITGASLKLLHALYKGRHCVTTPAMVEGTGLEAACHIGTSANAIAAIISQLYYRPFEEEEIELREKLLYDTYNNDVNVEKFISYLW
ncbi:glycosyltransferase family 4 protein [Niabella sp. A18]|uniref:Glycosyltransferase family 4 protein n=1 Tax=Niabella digestorum TaxID=3117701 RepID=A0ABU7RFQ8_9BACT